MLALTRLLKAFSFLILALVILGGEGSMAYQPQSKVKIETLLFTWSQGLCLC